MTPPDTLVVGKSQDPQNLDPAFTQDNNDWTVTYPCYQRLMNHRQRPGRCVWVSARAAHADAPVVVPYRCRAMAAPAARAPALA